MIEKSKKFYIFAMKFIFVALLTDKNLHINTDIYSFFRLRRYGLFVHREFKSVL